MNPALFAFGRAKATGIFFAKSFIQNSSETIWFIVVLRLFIIRIGSTFTLLADMRILWLLKLGITMLLRNKDYIQFVTEFPCFLRHPVVKQIKYKNFKNNFPFRNIFLFPYIVFFCILITPNEKIINKIWTVTSLATVRPN